MTRMRPHRPWDRMGEVSPYTLGAVIAKDPAEAKMGVGWAVLELPKKKIAAGEKVLDAPLSPARAAMAAVLLLRRQTGHLSPDKRPTVQLYRYTAKSWPRSVAAFEGGTLEHHEQCVEAVAKALRHEGADVVVRMV